jgi:O-antigen/teichoic acid export membrane protein
MFSKQIAEWLPKGGFLRNVATLMTGTGFAQGIMLAAAPILTRLYTPEDFGLLGTYMAIFTSLSVLSCWSYDPAIVLPEKEEDAANLLVLAFTITTGMSATILGMVAMFRQPTATLLGAPGLSDLLWLLPVSIFGTGLFQAFNYWSIRKKQFERVAVARIFRSVATVAMQTGFGSVGAFGAGGLVGGLLAGHLAGPAVLGRQTLRQDMRLLQSSLGVRRMLELAKRYRKYPLFLTWPSVLDSLTQWLPILFFTKFFGIAVSGQYVVTMRLLQIPAAALGEAVGQVYFQRLAEHQNLGGDIGGLVEKTTVRLFAIAILFCSIVVVVAPTFFAFILGESWRTAGQYAQILAPAMGLRFVVSPLSMVLIARNRPEIAAIWKVGALILTVSTLFFSLLFATALYTVIALTIADIFLYTIYLLFVFHVGGARFQNLFKPIFWAK